MEHKPVLKRIVRYGTPTPLDREPFGTIWEAKLEFPNLYMQVSEQIEAPKWIALSHLLSVALQDMFEDTTFMYECLRLYKYHDEKPLLKISQLLKDKC